MMNITERLADFAANLKFTDLPAEVIELTRTYILDYYASAMAGYKVNREYNEIIENIYFGMGGTEEAYALFSNKKLPVINAAFMYATYAHGADMDDGNRKAMGHVGAPVISAVLPLAETLPGITEEEVITAINVGYDIYNRVAAGVQPGLVKRGFHSTGTAGVIGAAAAAGNLLKLTEKQMYNAMAIACTQASGLLIVAESGQSCKPMNPARAASGGILSAKMAMQGLKSFNIPLESKKGWFHAMSDSVDENVVLENLGKVFTISESYLKPYPSCRHTHCGLEAAKILLSEVDAPIEKAEMYIYNNAIQIAGQIVYPETNEDTKFSIHYSMACMLANGSFGLADLNVAAAKPEVKAMTEKITLIPDDSLERRDEGIRGSRLKLYLENGKVLEKEVLIPLGDAAHPMSREELIEKLRDCGAGVQSIEEQDAHIARIDAFGQNKPYTKLL